MARIDASGPSPSKWDQFEKLIDLHKFYFENLIKAAGFSLGLIGAIFTFVFAAKFEGEMTKRIALGLPVVISLGTLAVFCVGIVKTLDLAANVRKVQKGLVEWRPHAEILVWMCGVFALVFLATSVGLLVLIADPSLVPSPLPKPG